MVYSFSELNLGGLYPETEFVDKSEVINKDLVIEDIKKFEGIFGEYYIVKAQLENKLVSFVISGTVIKKKFDYVIEKNMFPITGKIVKPKGKRYYDII